MSPPSVIDISLQKSLFLAFCLALIGCHAQPDHSLPSIEFTHIPPAAQGGRERVDTISGRVRNARPKQQIVIYAHSGQWWVQPWPDHPFIPIKADSTWSTETHLGFEYAALLVEPDYHPLPDDGCSSDPRRFRCSRDNCEGRWNAAICPDRIA